MELSTAIVRNARRAGSKLLVMFGAVAVSVTSLGGTKTEAGPPRVVGEFSGLPKGGAARARPTRARHGDRGGPRVIADWSGRMAYLQDTVCLSR